MKPFKYKNKIYRWIYVKIKRLFSSEKRARYPKHVSQQERTVAEIFINILHNNNSQLYYNNRTGECYLKLDSEKIFIFLESHNIKIINSNFGYDTHISNEMEFYLSSRFDDENTKRKTLMKEEALSKIEYSLSKTLKKLQC